MDREDRRLARGRRLYEYHCYEGEDSSDAALWHHTHQAVAVVGRVDADPEVGRMYRVRFTDGFEGDVFADELLRAPCQYQRPDYRPAEAAQ